MYKLINDEKLYNEPHLLVSPTLAEEIGICNAILLQHIHYLLSPTRNKNFKDNRYWIRNSPLELQKQIKCMSYGKIKRAIKLLKDHKILISRDLILPSLGLVECCTINYAKLMELKAYQEPELGAEHNEAIPTLAQRLGTAIEKLVQSLIRRGKNL